MASGTISLTYEILRNFWGSQNGQDRAQKCGALLVTAVILTFLLPLDSSGEENIIVSAGDWLFNAIILVMFSGVIARKFWAWSKIKLIPTFLSTLLYTGYTAIPILAISTLYGWAVTHNYIDDANEELWQNILATYSTSDYVIWVFTIYISTLLFIGPISLAAIKFSATGTTEDEPSNLTASTPVTEQKFLNRLSPQLGTDLICLTMEDHYIRVYTTQGNELIHMRMSDAMEELQAYSGVQVHRSWWVASAAIKNVTKEQRRYTVHLTNDLSAPIARNRVAAMKDAGFL